MPHYSPSPALSIFSQLRLAVIIFLVNPLMWTGLRPETVYAFAIAPLLLLLLAIAGTHINTDRGSKGNGV